MNKLYLIAETACSHDGSITRIKKIIDNAILAKFSAIQIQIWKHQNIVIPSHKDIKLLKVEGEGAEPEIIEGLGIQLESVQYISADLSDERGLTLEYTVTQVTNFLLSNNFEMLDFSPDRFIFLFRNKKISLNSNDLNN